MEPSVEALLDSATLTSAVQDSATPSSTTTLFTSTAEMLDHVTRSWRSHYVTTSLTTYDAVAPFVKRPFFLLVSVDGPLRRRYERERTRVGELSLETFIDQHDNLLSPRGTASDYRQTAALANVTIYNHYDSIARLYIYLDSVNLLNEERLRPGWDMYFMVRPLVVAVLTKDARLTRFPPIKLHEAPCRRFARPLKADPFNWLQRNPSRVDQLQRGWVFAV